MTPAGWEGILDADEEIVWQGRPDGKVIWRISNIATFIFGLFFAGFALFWMVMAAGAGGFFWMFGLLHFSVGLSVAFGSLFWSAYLRRHSWYTLTNKRAFIARDLPIRGRVLKSYPITPSLVLEFDNGEPATIHFASEQKRSSNGSYTTKIGFIRINDGRDVYGKIRAIQKGLE